MPYATARECELSLVQRWRDGDRQAGGVLIARYFDRVVTELASYGLGAGARAGEVFVRVERELAELGSHESFSALVLTHARAVARAKVSVPGCGPLNETVDLVVDLTSRAHA